MRRELLRKRKEIRHLWKANARLRKREMRLERIIRRHERLVQKAPGIAMDMMMGVAREPSFAPIILYCLDPNWRDKIKEGNI